MDLGKSSQSVNCIDVDTRKRSLIERSLFEHIPIPVSINVLIFLKNRSNLLLMNARHIIFNVERLIKL